MKPAHTSPASASPRRRFVANAAALRRLDNLFKRETAAKWKIADAVVELVDGLGYQITVLAKRYGRQRNTLSAYYHCAKTFSRNDRDPAVGFGMYDNARQAARRWDFDPMWCLQLIVTHGLTQRRDVSRFFAQKRRERDNAKARNQSACDTLSAAFLYNRCNHADGRAVAQTLPDASIKLANLDLPYGPYAAYRDGTHENYGLARTDCDGNTADEVKKLLADLLRILGLKMSHGSVALLYRPGGFHDPLYSDIVESVDLNGWRIEHIVIWDKRRTKLARADAPYSSRTETIYVLARRGDQLVNHDGSCRDNIVSMSASRYRRGEECKHHLFEKPLNLCTYLIGKHTYEGEVVFDACGCSGAMCIAAAQMGRRWIYCETNAANFEWGSRRVADAVSSSRRAVV